MKIGIVSDTHDLLRPEVLAELEDCGAILHAGDISSPGILAGLREIAPVYAVRGNNDRDWDDPLPLVLDLELAGLRIAMAHKKKDLPGDLSVFDLAVTGHTHRYAEARLTGEKRTLLLNPGCCGPRLFRQPVTMAKVTVGQDGWKAERIDIPQGEKETAPPVPGRDIRRQIEAVMSGTRKGLSPEEIAKKHRMDPALAEQIARLYLTHPGVTADGIMTKMGL